MITPYYIPNGLKTFPFCDLLFSANHVLVSGTTGSGKSVLIYDYIYSLVGKYFPNQLKMVLIDPKRVDLTSFCPLPHVVKHVTETKEIISVLDEVINVMESRYDDMARRGIKEYDGAYLLIVIDEIADLMTTCKKDFMPRIQRIAQLGRASRIKLICATQCPSRDVIPAKLTVNFNGRVGLRCNDTIESRQIIKRAGAENLPLHGTALYRHDNGKYYELKIPYVGEEEIKKRVRLWQSQTPSEFYTNRKIKHGF